MCKSNTYSSFISKTSLKFFARLNSKNSGHKNSFTTSTVDSSFNRETSKYKYDENLTAAEIEQKKQSIPQYLLNNATSDVESYKNREVSNKKTSKPLVSGKRMLLARKEFQRKPKKEFLIKEKREAKNLEFEQKKYKLLSKSDKALMKNNRWSINRHNINFVSLEKQKMKLELQETKALKQIEDKSLFNTELIESDFYKDERLAKRLAKMGVCSRRYAEKLIEKGMVKVDGKYIDSNVPVNIDSNIQIFTKQGYQTPLKESQRIWVFYKPQGFVCTSKDIRVSLLNKISNYRIDLPYSRCWKIKVFL